MSRAGLPKGPETANRSLVTIRGDYRLQNNHASTPIAKSSEDRFQFLQEEKITSEQCFSMMKKSAL
jgi:hypothetical protein